MSMSAEQAENQPPTPPEPEPKRKLSLTMLFWGIFAVVILTGGSTLWFSRGDNMQPGNNLVDLTPTPTSSPTLLPTPVTPPAQSLFYDTFANNEHGWSLAGDSQGYRTLTGDTLTLVNRNPDTTFIESVPLNTNLSNYQISVDFTVNEGDARDGTGLYLRGDSNLDHDYRVDVNGNGTIDIVKEWLDDNLAQQETSLYYPHPVANLKPEGQQNTLTVIMLDSTIVVEINGLVQATVYDSSYATGQIALFARHGITSSGISVAFHRVEIDRLALPSDVLTPTPSVTPAGSNP
jgi:hypothetical protein